MTKPIPDGFHTTTPSIVVNNSKEAIEFYKKAFDAKEIYQMPTPDGKTMHAMIQIGDSFVMMCDEFPHMGMNSPTTVGGTSTTIHLYVEDSDKMYNQAVNAGAKPTMPIMDAFWGDRCGTILDPFGHSWMVSTHKKDLSPDEMQKAAQEYMAKQQH
ncbi:VOC family protein [Nitrosopumilus sp.]|uniref:VOC family protein n=1 Tax=Nitrosopumilus sp. TaxID=2024843 RepID=UPI002930359F|nr:VOC family protein [Nitrosopumilus sp.]